MKRALLTLLLFCSALAFGQTPLSERTETTTPAAGDYTWWLDADSPGALRKISWANLFKAPVLSGTVTGTYTLGGTPTFPSTLTLDTEWDTVGEVETLWSANIILASEIDTIAELNALIGDADLQPLDADLTALAALSGTNTIYYRSASNTWTAVTIGSGLSFSTGTLSATGGAGTGSVNTVKEDGSQLGGSDIVTLDFLGADFDLTESPDTEVNITIAGALTRDTEWDTAAEVETIWSANILLESEIDASSELRALMDDETGTGVLVFGTSPTIADPTFTGTTTVDTLNVTTFSAGSFLFEGSTADANETTLTVVDPTADQTISLPNATGTVVLKDTTDTLSAKTVAISAALGTDDTLEGTTITGLNNSGGVTQWDAVYLNGSSAWVGADANGSGTYPCRGLATATASNGAATTVVTRGTVRNDAWTWTPGGDVYLSTTAAGLTQTAPSASGDKVQVIGFALTADILFVNITGEYLTIE